MFIAWVEHANIGLAALNSTNSRSWWECHCLYNSPQITWNTWHGLQSSYIPSNVFFARLYKNTLACHCIRKSFLSPIPLSNDFGLTWVEHKTLTGTAWESLPADVLINGQTMNRLGMLCHGVQTMAESESRMSRLHTFIIYWGYLKIDKHL